MSDLESQLKRQTIRQIPSHWRKQILAEAQRHAVADKPRSVPLWRELLWPCPQVWAGFAAAWLLALFLNVSVEKFPSESMAAAKPALENADGYAQRQSLLVEMLGDGRASASVPAFVPRRRSEGLHERVTV